ncbi:MAG: ATP-binding protein [Bacteroidota bacterium]
MRITFNGKFKSITDFVWENIPDFVVITGPNGSGKTQLLELIFDTVTNSKQNFQRVNFENVSFKPIEVTFLQGEWHLQNTRHVDLAILQSNSNNRFSQFNSERGSNFHSLNQQGKYKFLAAIEDVKTKSGKEYAQITADDFNKFFPDFFIEQDNELSQKISETFYNYRLSEIELLAQQVHPNQIVERIGEKPWEVLKAILKEAKLPFVINDPSNSGFRDKFKLQLSNSVTNENIEFTDLSSGEKVLISLMFYLYSSQEKAVFPKLLLLDEPDAHLHPSMSQQFLNVIKNVLVDKFKVKVIMTTHSPSTVILAPVDSIYEMSKEEPRIKKSPSKNHSVSLLTAGLVYVGEGTKYFLVEDKDDVEFYSYIYNQMVLDQIIESDIPLVFIPASTNNKSGGKDVVQNWVKKLEDSGLQNILHGLIDEDSGNAVSGEVYKIDRYSIENYLIDPLIVFAILIDKEKAPEVDGLKLTIGEEYKLKTLEAEKLQKIVDYVFNSIEPELPNFFADFNATELDRLDIKFTNGIVLSYPKWIINRRGKTLLNEVYNKVFTSSIVNHTTLFKAMRKLNFFPLELLAKFNELKSISHE